MKYEVLIRDEAEQDIKSAMLWYGDENEELAKVFATKLSNAIDIIRNNPFLFSVKYRNVRMTFLSKFPYGIHYTIEGRRVIVLAVLHTRRKPRS